MSSVKREELRCGVKREKLRFGDGSCLGRRVINMTDGNFRRHDQCTGYDCRHQQFPRDLLQGQGPSYMRCGRGWWASADMHRVHGDGDDDLMLAGRNNIAVSPTLGVQRGRTRAESMALVAPMSS